MDLHNLKCITIDDDDWGTVNTRDLCCQQCDSELDRDWCEAVLFISNPAAVIQCCLAYRKLDYNVDLYGPACPPEFPSTGYWTAWKRSVPDCS